MTVLNQALSTVISKLFPELQLSPAAGFLPMLDLEKGELSSSAAIEIARLTRRNAAAIAQEILNELVPAQGGEWRVDAGYLVLVRVPDPLLRTETRSLDELCPVEAPHTGAAREILGLIPDATTPVYARLRLIGYVGLQALLTVALEKRVWMGFEPEPFELVENYDGVVSLVRRAVERVLHNEGEVRLDLVAREKADGVSEPRCVWTSHHYFDRLSKRALAALNADREAGRISIRMPNDGWLLSRDRVLPELIMLPYLKRVVARLSTTSHWLRWIFHAASPIPSGDFDPAVALYDEGASPLWNAQALIERFDRIVGRAPLHAASPVLENIPDAWRTLVMRATFLPVWTARAVREGEIPGWSKVLCEFCALAHAFLNAPASRKALGQGGPNDELRQIVASVEFGLSSILSVVATKGE
jgi:hypothetical protein